jgi:NTE family protein
MLAGRAVILGGGAVTGIAWEIGVLQGLADNGVDLSDADAIIGTSAGSFAGTYLACGLVGRYFAAQLTGEIAEIPAAMSVELVARWQEALRDARGDTAALGRALGEIGLNAETVTAAERMAVVRARLPGCDWPEAPLKMTAIDAETGELHLLDRSSGAPLEIAAAASGALPGVWPVVEALGRRWIDAGAVSSTNAALGEGFAQVVVIAASPDGFPGGRTTHEDVELLAAAGASVVLIAPDDQTVAAIGEDAFDPRRRPDAARAGRLQGRAVAADVRQVWAVPTRVRDFAKYYADVPVD